MLIQNYFRFFLYVHWIHINTIRCYGACFITLYMDYKKIDECIFQLMNLINLSFDSIYQSFFNFDYRFLLANCYYLGSELLYLWSWYSHKHYSIVISGCKYRFIWALLCKSPKVLSLHLSILLSIHKTTFWSPCLDYTCILSLRPLSHTSPKMSACKGCAETWNQSSLVKGHGHQPHVKSTHILIPHFGPIWMGHTSVLACG